MKKKFYYIFNTSTDFNFAEKTKKIIESYLLSIIFIIISFPILKLIDLLIVNYMGFESVIELIAKSKENIGLKYNWVYVIILVPLIEEIIFRLHLKPKLLNLQISSALIIFYIVNGKIFNVDFFSITFFISIIIISISAFIIKTNYSLIRHFYINKNKLITIISIILFGIGHIANIGILHYQISILYFIFILPQIIIGYFITNIRLKLGFFWGLSLHALINGISFFLFS